MSIKNILSKLAFAAPKNRIVQGCFIALLATIIPLGNVLAANLDSRLPGGRGNYVVSMASFVPGSATANWLRLGTYQFYTNGTVTARMWLWSQAKPATRVSTGVTPIGANCATTSKTSYSAPRQCAVLTASGFTGAPNDVRTGTFKLTGVSPQILSITWTTNGKPWSETYIVENNPVATQPMSQLRMTYNTAIAKDPSAPGGFRGGVHAYGSVRALTERRAMVSVLQYRNHTAGGMRQETLNYNGASRTVSKPGIAKFDYSAFKLCSGNSRCASLLSVVQGQNGPCSCKYAPSDRRLNTYWVQVANDRRDNYAHWCTCLTVSQNQTSTLCYGGNSHIKPMLQVLDDNGYFAGYVGVEASFGNNGRSGDMLSLFRFTEYL